jgi:MOSC domain-containing protein YiiM
MFEGRLEAICIAGRKCELPSSVDEVRTIPGCGLGGDRYCLQQGTFTKPNSPDRELTLIESEAVEAMALECKISLPVGHMRRNLVTRGVPLNHLVGKEFRIGEVLIKGIRLCEPCSHLESLTVKGVVSALQHRGGLRAQILSEGILRVGDIIRDSA